MSRFKEKKSGTPAISTASLPDIIFMLLFFFMVTTVMREVDLKVKVVLPEAKEVAKLEDRPWWITSTSARPWTSSWAPSRCCN